MVLGQAKGRAERMRAESNNAKNKKVIRYMANDLTTTNGSLQTEDSEYVRLVSLISGLNNHETVLQTVYEEQ